MTLTQRIDESACQVYRCWLIWNRSFLVVLGPFLCWLGSIACGVSLLYIQYLLESGSGDLSNEMFAACATFWTCTIMINVSSTGASRVPCFLDYYNQLDRSHRHDPLADMENAAGLETPQHMLRSRHTSTKPSSICPAHRY